MLLLVMIWSFTSRTHRTGGFWAQPVGIWFTVCSCMFPSAWTPPWKHVCPVHRNAVSYSTQNSTYEQPKQVMALLGFCAALWRWKRQKEICSQLQEDPEAQNKTRDGTQNLLFTWLTDYSPLEDRFQATIYPTPTLPTQPRQPANLGIGSNMDDFTSFSLFAK